MTAYWRSNRISQFRRRRSTDETKRESRIWADAFRPNGGNSPSIQLVQINQSETIIFEFQLLFNQSFLELTKGRSTDPAKSLGYKRALRTWTPTWSISKSH